MKDADVDRLKELLKRLETTPDVVRLSSFKPEILGDCTVGDLRQSLSQEAVREAVQRIYTRADMEAACELVLAGYRSKPMLDKMVDRFLAWPLPDSVCADLIATRQGPGRIGTNLLSADEARQMLDHALKREPNAAAQGGPAASQSVAGTDHAGQASPAPAAPDVASIVRQLEGFDTALMQDAAALLMKLGQQVETLQAAHDLGWAHKTCPNCGADMMAGASDE